MSALLSKSNDSTDFFQDNRIQLGGVLGLIGVPGSSNLDLARKGIKSKVGIVAQLIDVESGENVGAFEASAEANSAVGGVGISVMGIGGHHLEGSKTVTEEASQRSD